MIRAFGALGLEIEYALVDRVSLDVAAVADRVLQDCAGAAEPVNECTRGRLGWSNELVLHVLELKNLDPARDFAALRRQFHAEVTAMDTALAKHGARLMPGGMHPWMDPVEETRIWPHGHAPVYRAYDRIFGCRSHGWANLQSAHINLPFGDDAEFARLHAALRVVVPIVPALAASSPYMDGRASGILDGRMESYRRNADRVPELNGDLIPEIVSTRDGYERRILKPLYAALRPHDPEGVLQEEWINARGAIARFDRNALEIRVMDAQECPEMDVALAAFFFDLAQSLYEREFEHPAEDTQLPNRPLADILVRCIHDADRARIENGEYLALFGLRRDTCDAAALVAAIAERLDRENAPHRGIWREAIEFALTRGPLARRLLRAIGPRPDRAALHELYSALCDALAAGKPFDP